MSAGITLYRERAGCCLCCWFIPAARTDRARTTARSARALLDSVAEEALAYLELNILVLRTGEKASLIDL